jgi:SAM-dependent methyltransferase
MAPNLQDQWAAGENYDAFMGRWSRMLAPRFVSWLCIPRATRWLEVGCGTGALTSAICKHADPESVVSCDPAAPFIEYARRQICDVRVSFVEAGAGSLPSHPEKYGVVTSLFALNFFPDVDGAICEQRSLTALGGTVSACVWDYAQGMGFLRHFWDAAVSEDIRARELDEGGRFPVCTPEALLRLFDKSGLSSVRCDPIEIATEFSSFDEFWRPFLGGTGPAPSYVSTLDIERRKALEEKLKRTLPTRADGTIVLTARAWAVRGTVW